MNELISVIIPAYNCGSYIIETVKSVLNQSYARLEVIVVDDGSTDDTPERIRQISDERFIYIRTQNKGNYFARNTGLAQAQGDLIAFLDADDQMMPDKLLKQHEQFVQNPDLGLCCTNFYVQFEGQSNVYQDTSYSFGRNFDTANGFIEKALENNFMLTSTIMVRRQCIEKLGPFKTDYQNAMDYEFCLRVLFNYQACYMCEKLTKRLEHESDISRNKVNTYRALLFILEECAPEYSTAPYYRPRHADMIKRKWRKSMYHLGLEYLASGRFAEAYVCLRKCRYPEKRLFRLFALFAARSHSTILSSWIAGYRTKKQRGHLQATEIFNT